MSRDQRLTSAWVFHYGRGGWWLTERPFALLHRNAASPTAYYNLPTDRVVTLGTQVNL